MKNDELLRKWLKNDLTNVELKEFEKLEDFKISQKIVEKAGHFNVPDDAIIRDYAEFKSAVGTKKQKVKRLKQVQVLYKLAAVFVFGVGIYFLFFFNQWTTVQTLASQQVSFELPDASTVVLNADSKVKYNKDNWNENRAVVLAGEAFFDVSKGSTFEVLSSLGTVTVLGTKFNVKSRVNLLEVTCFEGLVQVISNGKIEKLSKGKIFRFSGEHTKLDSVRLVEPTWLNKVSNFEAISLFRVIDELERQYNIQIDVSQINTDLIFTGSFVNDDLEQALMSVLEPFSIKYIKSNSNKISLYKSE